MIPTIKPCDCRTYMTCSKCENSYPSDMDNCPTCNFYTAKTIDLTNSYIDKIIDFNGELDNLIDDEIDLTSLSPGKNIDGQ